jgi:hypothetical protein
LRLGELAGTYRSIRAAAGKLNARAGNPVVNDLGGEFFFAKNVRALWPTFAPGRKPPWPTDSTLDFLIWSARNGLELWLPTNRQINSAWDDMHGAAVERQKHHRQQLEGYRAAFG